METQTQWYYGDEQGRQLGPLSREDFLRAIERDRLPPDTLVWRDGLAQWQPLASLMAELAPPAAPAVPAGFPPSPPPPTFRTPPPAPIPTDVVYAGFIRRWAALLLDGLVLGAISFVLIFALVMAVGLSVLGHGHQPDPALAAWFLLIYPLVFGVALLYYSLQESSVHQATLGKRALGIKVTDLDGRRISWKHAIGRWFAAALSHLTMDIGFLMAAFTERKQALHDMVAGTLVVDRWAYTDQPQRQNRQTSGCLILLLVAAFAIVPIVAILAAIAIPAYQGYLTRAHVAAAIAQAQPLEPLIVEAWQANRQCPRNGEAGIRAAEDYASTVLGSIRTGAMKNGGDCAIELTLRVPGQHTLDGKRIWLTMDSGSGIAPSWRCRAELPNRDLPTTCRTEE